ncbi:MAG: hypothetical protein ACE5KU_02925, partial [Nitrososphaerales archaeon]
ESFKSVVLFSAFFSSATYSDGCSGFITYLIQGCTSRDIFALELRILLCLLSRVFAIRMIS